MGFISGPLKPIKCLESTPRLSLNSLPTFSAVLASTALFYHVSI